jgi:predicted nucleic acid-binding Zn ribbon protein
MTVANPKFRTFNCLQCSAPTRVKIGRGEKKFCSDKCRGLHGYYRRNPAQIDPNVVVFRTDCKVCGVPLPEKRRASMVYCSASCVAKESYVKRPLPEILGCSSNLGTIHELLTAADLMAQGFKVFRALSGDTCDLIAMRKGRCFTVEVKTGVMRKKGSANIMLKPHQRKYDVYALVTPTGIEYRILTRRGWKVSTRFKSLAETYVRNAVSAGNA